MTNKKCKVMYNGVLRDCLCPCHQPKPQEVAECKHYEIPVGNRFGCSKCDSKWDIPKEEAAECKHDYEFGNETKRCKKCGLWVCFKDGCKCDMKHEKEEVADWKEELKNHETLHNGNCNCEDDDVCKGKLESFITKTIAQEKEKWKDELIKEIEIMKEEEYVGNETHIIGVDYNQALSDIINKIKSN